MDCTMMQTEFDPARLVLSQPTCAKCGEPMWLVRIEPNGPAHDKRTFECPQCGNEVEETIKYR